MEMAVVFSLALAVAMEMEMAVVFSLALVLMMIHPNLLPSQFAKKTLSDLKMINLRNQVRTLQKLVEENYTTKRGEELAKFETELGETLKKVEKMQKDHPEYIQIIHSAKERLQEIREFIDNIDFIEFIDNKIKTLKKLVEDSYSTKRATVLRAVEKKLVKTLEEIEKKGHPEYKERHPEIEVINSAEERLQEIRKLIESITLPLDSQRVAQLKITLEGFNPLKSLVDIMTAALLLLGEDIKENLENVELAHTIAPLISNIGTSEHHSFLRRVEEFDVSTCDAEKVSRVDTILENYEGKIWDEQSKDVKVVHKWVTYVRSLIDETNLVV